MFCRATNTPFHFGILWTVDANWKTTKSQAFFSHSYTAPTPSIHTIQQLELGITKAFSLHIWNAVSTHLDHHRVLTHQSKTTASGRGGGATGYDFGAKKRFLPLHVGISENNNEFHMDKPHSRQRPHSPYRSQEPTDRRSTKLRNSVINIISSSSSFIIILSNPITIWSSIRFLFTLRLQWLKL